MIDYGTLQQAYEEYRRQMEGHQRACAQLLRKVYSHLLDQLDCDSGLVYFLSSKSFSVEPEKAVEFDHHGVSRSRLAIEFQLPETIPHAFAVRLEIRSGGTDVLELKAISGDQEKTFTVAESTEAAALKGCVDWICQTANENFRQGFDLFVKGNSLEMGFHTLIPRDKSGQA